MRRCGRQPKWPPQKRPEEATRGRSSRETTAGIETQRNSCETTASVETQAPPHRVRRCGPQPKWPPPEEAQRSQKIRKQALGIFVCVCVTLGLGKSGKATVQEAGIRAKPQWERRNATEFVRNHSGSIETHWNSCETTAGASKQRPRPTACAVAAGNLSGPPLKRPEEATRGRNSRETAEGASKRNGIRATPQRERRNEGPAPPRAPWRPAT